MLFIRRISQQIRHHLGLFFCINLTDGLAKCKDRRFARLARPVRWIARSQQGLSPQNRGRNALLSKISANIEK